MAKKHRLFYGKKRIKSNFIYKQEDINSVLYKLEFYSIIAEFVSLRKSGKDYVGRCPFCKPLTKNDWHFRVSERKKIFKCFECGKAGKTSIAFLMKYYKISFGDAFIFCNRNYTKLEIKPLRNRWMERKPHTDDNLPF
jgi:DNA primase